MATIVRMPKLGLTMTEGLISKWLRKEGEYVEKGEPLLEIQTDKVNLEEETPASGILRKILYKEGTSIAIVTPIAVIAEAGEELPELGDISCLAEKEKAQEGSCSEDKQFETVNRISIAGSGSPSIGRFGKIKASPAAKRLAKEKKIDLYHIVGSGQDSRITSEDVMRFIENTLDEVSRVSPVAKKIADEEGILLREIDLPQGKRVMKSHVMKHTESSAKTPSPLSDNEILEELPMTGMRKIIADKMSKSTREAPHYYLTVEVDMVSAISLRKELNQVIKSEGVKISFNDLLIKVAARALQSHRIINSRVSGDRIELLKRINIGLAVALGSGLIVPVIKDADRKSLKEVALETTDLVRKAKDNKLTPGDYTGGTFTISNLGMYDIIRFTAIINQPESAILAIGKIQDKPVVTSEREIEVRPMMNITLSSDHRVIDGAEGAKFLQDLKNILENPARLLL